MVRVVIQARTCYACSVTNLNYGRMIRVACFRLLILSCCIVRGYAISNPDKIICLLIMHMSLRTLLGEVDVQNALARLRLTWVQFQLTAEVHSDLPHGRGKIEVTTKDQGLSTRSHACSTATNVYSSPSLSRRRRRARTLASRRALAVGRVGFPSGAARAAHGAPWHPRAPRADNANSFGGKDRHSQSPRIRSPPSAGSPPLFSQRK